MCSFFVSTPASIPKIPPEALLNASGAYRNSCGVGRAQRGARPAGEGMRVRYAPAFDCPTPNPAETLMSSQKIDEKRRHLAQQLRQWSVEDFHDLLAQEGVE